MRQEKKLRNGDGSLSRRRSPSPRRSIRAPKRKDGSTAARELPSKRQHTVSSTRRTLTEDSLDKFVVEDAEEQRRGAIEELTSQIKSSRGGHLARIHSELLEYPTGVDAHFHFYLNTMIKDQDKYGEQPLTREEREFIAVTVSKANSCKYCIAHHEEAQRQAGGSSLLPVGKAKRATSPESPADDQHFKVRRNALQKIAETLSKTPHKARILQAELVGNGDGPGILSKAEYCHAVLVASYFNMANRIAFGLDLDIEESFEDTCS